MRRVLKVLCAVGGAVLIAGLASPVGHAHTSLRTYWLAIPNSFDFDASRTAFLSIVSGTTATYQVTGGGGSFTTSGTVRPNNPRTVALPSALHVTSSETVENKGIRVTATAPIGVTLFADADGSQGATGVYPAGALGTSYHAVGYQESIPGDPSGFPSTLTIVSTRAGTSVDVTPSCAGDGGALAGVKLDVELAAGETWQLLCDSSQDITGSTVTSDEPVAVFGGNYCAVIVPGPACDHVMEQMAPVSRWGRTFFLVPLADEEPDLVRFNGGDEAATLTVTGTAPGFPTSLPANAQLEASLDDGNPVRIVSTKPIHITQFTRSVSDNTTEDGDPSMLVVSPTGWWASSYRFVAPAGITTTKLTIVRPNGTTVRLDGTALSGYQAMPGGTHSYKIVTVPAGQHVVRASRGIAAYVQGSLQYEGVAFTPGVNPVKAGTRTTLSVGKTASKVKASGRVRPHGKGRMVVKLFRKVNGKWKLLATKRPRLSATSRYAAAFGRPAAGACKMTARFSGDADHLPSSAKRTFRC